MLQAEKRKSGLKSVCNACLIGKFMKQLYERANHVIKNVYGIVWGWRMLISLNVTLFVWSCLQIMYFFASAFPYNPVVDPQEFFITQRL